MTGLKDEVKSLSQRVAELEAKVRGTDAILKKLNELEARMGDPDDTFQTDINRLIIEMADVMETELGARFNNLAKLRRYVG